VLNIPNLFVIGAPKCGTSALAQYLSEHESVFFSEPKEPFFFVSECVHMRSQHFLDTQEHYLELFAEAEPSKHKVIAEGSTNYLWSKNAVSEIEKLNCSAKYIVILRDPVEVVHGFHMEQVYARNEHITDFDEAWSMQEQRLNGEGFSKYCRVPEFLQYREFALFGLQLERLFSLVPKERVLVLFQEDMKKDMTKVYSSVMDFLNIKNDKRTSFPKINSAHVHRSNWIANFILSPPGFLEKPMLLFRKYAREKKPRFIECAKKYLKKEQKRASLKDSTVRGLRESFSEDICLTERILGVSLNHWK